MNFKNCVVLQDLLDNACQLFDETINGLDTIEKSLKFRMGDKTFGGTVASIFATILWMAVFTAFLYFMRPLVNKVLFYSMLIACALFVIIMLMDEVATCSYYGKLSSYRKDLERLKNRMELSKELCKDNLETFMSFGKIGWDRNLEVASSIPAEATSIVRTLNKLVSYKMGFLNTAKNFFYYLIVILITLVSAIYMLDAAQNTVLDIITGITGSRPFDIEAARTFAIIGFIIASIGEIILARLAWSKTDCSVTNMTLLVLPLGPILCFALAIVVGLIVLLFMGLVIVAIGIGVIAFLIGLTTNG